MSPELNSTELNSTGLSGADEPQWEPHVKSIDWLYCTMLKNELRDYRKKVLDDPNSMNEKYYDLIWNEYKERSVLAREWFEKMTIDSRINSKAILAVESSGGNPLPGFSFNFPKFRHKRESKSTWSDGDQYLVARELSAVSNGALTVREALNELGFTSYGSGTPVKMDSMLPMLEVFTRVITETPDLGPVLFVDIETTGTNPMVSEVIDIGGVQYKNLRTRNGMSQFQKVYGMENQEYLKAVSVPVSEVHRMTPQDIAGAPLFRDAEQTQNLAKILNQPSVTLSAHNAEFEGLWFSYHIPGFAEKYDPIHPNQLFDLDKPAKLIDTLFYSTFLCQCYAGNLKNYSTYYGLDYTNAHRGLYDSHLAADAFQMNLEEVTSDADNMLK